jgi:glycosyltransferase involved in cell wall biosynthesis
MTFPGSPTQKMKILYVNWAPLHFGAQVGGGVNHYAQSMAIELSKRGHKVFSLSSGFAYSPRLKVSIQRAADFEGLKLYELFNSPILAPAYFNFRAPETECRCTPVDQAFRAFLRKTAPDVVHFHNIEGFSAACIPIAKEAGARVVYSLHNYHLVCSQVGLLYRGKEICTDFQGGRKCLFCLFPPPRKMEKVLRTGTRMIRQILPRRVGSGPFAERLKGFVSSLGREVRRQLGRTDRNSPEFPKRQQIIPDGSPYAMRRREMLAAVNRADRVLAVSRFVERLFVEMGVSPERISVNPIGTKMAEMAIGEAPCDPAKKPGEPIRMVFLGVADELKGLPFLFGTLTGMDDDFLRRIDLHVHARGIGRQGRIDETFARNWQNLERRLAGLHLFDGYRFEALPDILRDKDMGIVPPIWHDNAPQVVFEMLAMKVPVLGARMGGIPDFVAHEENGLLFDPFSPGDMERQLRRIVAHPELLRRYRKRIVPMKTLQEHARELEFFYSAGKP